MDSTSKPFPLEYQSPAIRTLGSSPIVRIVAAFAALVLGAIISQFVQRSRETLGGMLDWIEPIAAASAGSIYLLLISLNVAGRTKPGTISWLRRIGGIGSPIVLIPMAIEMVSDVLKDPYARMHDRIEWFAAAAVLIVFSLWVGILTILHWNKIVPFPGDDETPSLTSGPGRNPQVMQRNSIC